MGCVESLKVTDHCCNYFDTSLNDPTFYSTACTSLDSALKSGFIHNIEDLLPEKKKENEEKKETESADTSESISTPCSKLDLLLNPAQLLIEKFPIPGLPGSEHFLATCKEYQHVTDQSPMFSLDCEWVLCEGGILLM